MSIDHIFSLVGTTGSGKSQVAFDIANQVLKDNLVDRVVILSADSRQVYQSLEIITGADIPKNYQRQRSGNFKYEYFQHESLPIFLHGVSIISPLQPWSAGHFQVLFDDLIHRYSKNTLFLIVGGTMLYHSIVGVKSFSSMPKPDEKLREEIEDFSIEEMQNYLRNLDIEVFNSLNQSDVFNPRRLMRAIEKAKVRQKDQANDRQIYLNIDREQLFGSNEKSQPETKNIPDHWWYGITIDFSGLEEKIYQRVDERIKFGAFEEAENLEILITENKLSPDQVPAWSSCGVSFLHKCRINEVSLNECASLWAAHELRYAKRQLKWWKKQHNIEWFEDKEKLKLELLAKMKTS